MIEPMKAGDYTALGILNIRVQMKTMPATNIVGAYTNGIPFRVYEVYDEKDGIVWGRVSSNTGDGRARYVALRVNNNEKAKMEDADTVTNDTPLVWSINRLTNVLSEILDEMKKK